MENEYIIINKTTLQKNIEELKKTGLVRENHAERYVVYNEILSQSIPLIPEIEKSFNDGFHKGYNIGHADVQSHPLALTIANHIHKDRQHYISNLKLDI